MLNSASGGVYSTADLAVILDRPHPARLTESIRTLLREGVLARVRRGLYVDHLTGYRPEVVGQRWIAPSYLSTEAALDRHGLCDTGVSAYTYVTGRLLLRRETARKVLDRRTFIYRHVAAHLFFGYRSEAGVLLAEPEKAVLDFLYFLYKGQHSVLSPGDIDYSRLDERRFKQYLRRFRQAGFANHAHNWFGKQGARG